jgi:hypothetical protein
MSPDRAREPRPHPARQPPRDAAAAHVPGAAARLLALQKAAGNAALQQSLAQSGSVGRRVLQRVIGPGAKPDVRVRPRIGGSEWKIDAVLPPQGERERYRLRHTVSTFATKIVFADDPEWDLVEPERETATSPVSLETPRDVEPRHEERKEAVGDVEERKEPPPVRSMPTRAELVADVHLGSIASDAPRNDLPIRRLSATMKGPSGLYRLIYLVGQWQVTVWWPAAWCVPEDKVPGPNELGWLPSAEFGEPTFFGECPHKDPLSRVEPFEYRTLSGAKHTPATAFEPT